MTLYIRMCTINFGHENVWPVSLKRWVNCVLSVEACQTGLYLYIGVSTEQVGQWAGSERASGELLRSSHLPRVPEGGAVDDLGSVASSMQPGVQSAQGRLPLYPPFGPPGRHCVLCWLGGWVEESQWVQVAREYSGKPPATHHSADGAGVLVVGLGSRWEDHSLLLQVGSQRRGEVLDRSPPTVVSGLRVRLPVGQQHTDHLSIKAHCIL